MNGQGIAANRRLTTFVSLVTLLALVVSIDMSQAGASPSASAAKKKCKKKKGKKKCKKRSGGSAPVTPPLTIVPRPPVAPPEEELPVRALLTWDTSADLDLHAWDEDGEHTGWDEAAGQDAFHIPETDYYGTSSEGDLGEAFVDYGAFEDRDFAYGVCYYPHPEQRRGIDRRHARVRHAGRDADHRNCFTRRSRARRRCDRQPRRRR